MWDITINGKQYSQEELRQAFEAMLQKREDRQIKKRELETRKEELEKQLAEIKAMLVGVKEELQHYQRKKWWDNPRWIERLRAMLWDDKNRPDRDDIFKLILLTGLYRKGSGET